MIGFEPWVRVPLRNDQFIAMCPEERIKNVFLFFMLLKYEVRSIPVIKDGASLNAINDLKSDSCHFLARSVRL